MSLSLDTLVTTLKAAASPQAPVEQKQAESQLEAWEIMPGYHFSLQQVYINQEVPFETRWLALICFKNGIDKYWRSSKQHTITKEEKAQIKSGIFELVGEKQPQFIIQIAHAVGKIARFDYPAEWPTLFEHILASIQQALQNQDLISVNNFLVILNRIVKTISSVRIGKARTTMQANSGQIIAPICQLYTQTFEQWTSNLDFSLMEVCYSSLKIIRRILPETQQFHKDQQITQFLELSVDHLQLLVVQSEKYSSDLLQRYVKCYSKMYLDLLNTNPTSFVLVPSSRKILTTYLSLLEHKAETIYNSTEDNDFWEVLGLKGFLILKRITTYLFKKGATTLRSPSDKEEVAAAIGGLRSFFEPSLVVQLSDLIISWYIKLTPADLESLAIEPEEWVANEQSSNWEYSIRACAGNFFQDLIRYFSEDLSDYVVGRISRSIDIPDSADYKSDQALVKEASFCTFQLSVHTIADRADIDQLMSQLFIPHAYAANKIIQRRICLILSEWIPKNKDEVYRLLVHLLNNSDVIVKLAAIQTLKSILADWDFDKAGFVPYVTEFIGHSIRLLTQLSLTESKLFVLETLASLIDKVNPLIATPILAELLVTIPSYWEASTAQNEPIMKNTLLRLLRNLVVALNHDSIQAHSFILPLISNCCSANSPDYALLSEDGYDLWLAALQYSTKSSPELFELRHLLPYALMNSTEILPTIISLLRSYALLDAPNSDEIALESKGILAKYLPNMRDDSFQIFIALMDILFLQHAVDEKFIGSVLNSGLLKSMAEYVCDENQSIPQANKILLVLSRITQNPEIFFGILAHTRVEPSQFVQIWIRNYTSNGNPRCKKINLMGLLNITSYGVESLASEFNQVVKQCLFFLEEVNETPQGSCGAYDEDYTYEDINDYRYLDPEIKPNGENNRYVDLLKATDPVYSTNLKDFLKQRLSSVKQSISDEQFNQLFGSDAYIIEQFGSL